MPNELIILGSSGGAMALIAFSGAIIETLRLGYQNVVNEPVPTEFNQLLEQLGGDSNADNSSNPAGS